MHCVQSHFCFFLKGLIPGDLEKIFLTGGLPDADDSVSILVLTVPSLDV